MQVTGPDDRWAWEEIDLGAVRRNARAFKQIIGPRTQMMCAVKADAYGHGAVECTKALHSGGASQFAVATVAEGVELRKAGIEWPILMLNQCPVEAVDTLIEYDIMPAVYQVEFALAYGERAAALGKVGKYHLAVDTGMTRIGVLPADAVEFRRTIDFHRGLECAGTFTHFATADEPANWDFELQANRFAETVEALRNAGLETGLVHCDNTPGTIMHPKQRYDMCRVGIGLYGLQPADITRTRIDLEPVMSVRARVIRTVYPQVGAGVSYGMTYRVPARGVQVATVPVGYADGLARVLSNRMEVLVNGQRMQQVGRICMDQFMFAVPVNTARTYRPVHPVEVGDIVTIIGRDGDDEITVDDMAVTRDTINYEVTCDFGLRLEKIYV
ncbi:MAG: alanine racemase [Olegusella sp.]|nr:alanine racemase [Olegusella sp.]